jgi:hypothetical protein
VIAAVLGVPAGLAPGIAVAYPLTSTDYGAGADPVVVEPWGLLAAVAVGCRCWPPSSRGSPSAPGRR